MQLNSFCMLDVECCSPRTTIQEAAQIMRRKHTGDLVDDMLKRLASDATLLTEVISQEQNHEARTRRQ